MSTLGLYLFSYLNGETAYWFIALASTLSGIGIGVVLPPLGRAVIMLAPSEKRGSASGIFNTMRNLGGPFGVAILPQFLETAMRSHVASSMQQSGMNQRIALYQGAIQGFSDTFLLATAICLIGVLMALLIPRAKLEHHRKSETHAPSTEDVTVPRR
ncbi:MAG: MFS transporter [Nitrososphaerales archaeon]|nr:MFS transporter [Nitrososphaerales archaeon]